MVSAAACGEVVGMRASSSPVMGVRGHAELREEVVGFLLERDFSSEHLIFPQGLKPRVILCCYRRG
jgi:hypothetical protein